MKKHLLHFALLSLVACPGGGSAPNGGVIDAAASAATISTGSVPVAATTEAPAWSRVPKPDTRPTPRAAPTTAFAHFAGQSTFDFQPGGTAGGTIYTDWPSTAQAIKLSPPPRWLYVDDTIASAHMTAGGPYDLDQTIILGNQASNTFTLHIDTGATFTSSSITAANGILISNENTAQSPWTPTTFFQLLIEPTAAVQSAVGAKPLLAVTNAGANGGQIDIEEAGLLGLSTVNVVTVGTGRSIFTVCQGPGTGGIGAHAFGGLGAVTVDRESSCTIGSPQDVTTFITINQSLGSQTAYTAALVANWSGTNPTSVANALDRIAAKITPIP